jgi:hypothetical protein
MLAGFLYKKWCNSNFHSAYLLLLQQIYRISAEIVWNELAARTSALYGLEVGAEREARWPVRCLAAAVDDGGER